jgi:hypothetical protein
MRNNVYLSQVISIVRLFLLITGLFFFIYFGGLSWEEAELEAVTGV